MGQAGLTAATLLAFASASPVGCASAGPPATAAASPVAGVSTPVSPIARGALEARQAPGPPPLPSPGQDRCEAHALAWLIGHPRTDIPVPVDLSRRRVACTACPVAPDVRLDRLNILYDAATNTVVRLTCG